MGYLKQAAPGIVTKVIRGNAIEFLRSQFNRFPDVLRAEICQTVHLCHIDDFKTI
jgi:hypothetical protein